MHQLGAHLRTRIQVRADTVYALKDGCDKVAITHGVIHDQSQRVAATANRAAEVEVAVDTECHARLIIRCSRENKKIRPEFVVVANSRGYDDLMLLRRFTHLFCVEETQRKCAEIAVRVNKIERDARDGST